MNLPDPAQSLAQRRQDFDEVVGDLPISEFQKLALRAAASALAKAHTVDALRTFAQSVKGPVAR